MRSIKDIKKDKSIKIFTIVFVTAVLSRFLLLGLGLITAKVLGSDVNLMDFLKATGDAPHYLDIAANGYASSGEAANKIVFYPLFPYLIKILGFVFRSHSFTALIISYASFGIAAAYLYKLMRIDYSEEKTLDALLFMFIAPYGMFFISIHTESLFLMLSIMCIYYSRKENWLAAAITGFFAALSKSQGMLLVVPVAYEAILVCVKNKKFDKKVLWSLLIPMGFAVYLLVNKAVQGDWFAFVGYQAAAPWYNTAKWVSDSLMTSYNVGVDNFALSTIIYWPQIVFFFIAVAFVFTGLYKKVRTSYLAFLGIYTLVTYFHGWMLSGSRYITACFVIYVVMASIDNKVIKHIMYIISGMMCLYLMALWLTAHAIM